MVINLARLGMRSQPCVLNNQPPRILGFIIEVPPRKRIFIPITRVTSIDNGHVIITGLLNMRRFEPRTNEITVLSEMLDRSVILIETEEKSNC